MATNIKLCFLIDCTFSMEPWIEMAKTQIRNIVSKTQREHPNTVFNVGFVGYRDFGDDRRFEVRQFTTNINQFLADIAYIHADGGGDSAEDVAGGLELVAGSDWGNADIRSIVHIADAPAHGYMMHERSVSDRYPKNDFGILNYVQACINLGIDYTFIRIDDSTDVMTNAFMAEYAKVSERTFILLDLMAQGNAHEEVFTAEMTRYVSSAVSRHTSSQFE